MSSNQNYTYNWILAICLLITTIIVVWTECKPRKDIVTVPDKVTDLVEGFLSDIANGDFKSAYKKTEISTWTYQSFVSVDKGFGGITDIYVYEVKPIRSTSDKKEAVVLARYDSFDKVNGDGQFTVKFVCRKFKRGWKIDEIETIRRDYKEEE